MLLSAVSPSPLSSSVELLGKGLFGCEICKIPPKGLLLSVVRFSSLLVLARNISPSISPEGRSGTTFLVTGA